MLRNYLLITLRNMMKNKLFILINVFGMAVAIGYKVYKAATMNPVDSLKQE